MEQTNEQIQGRRDGLDAARAMAQDGSATGHPAYERAKEAGIIQGLDLWGRIHGAAIASERARSAESNRYNENRGTRGINHRESHFHRRFPHLKPEAN